MTSKTKNSQTKLFNSPDTPIKRSKFDMSYRTKLTSNFNKLVPTMCQQLMPDDRVNLRTDFFTKWLPMLAPTFNDMNVRFGNYFVPHSQVWGGWNQFMGLGDDKSADYLLGHESREGLSVPHVTTKTMAPLFGEMCGGSATSGWYGNIFGGRSFKKLGHDKFALVLANCLCYSDQNQNISRNGGVLPNTTNFASEDDGISWVDGRRPCIVPMVFMCPKNSRYYALLNSNFIADVTSSLTTDDFEHKRMDGSTSDPTFVGGSPSHIPKDGAEWAMSCYDKIRNKCIYYQQFDLSVLERFPYSDLPESVREGDQSFNRYFDENHAIAWRKSLYRYAEDGSAWQDTSEDVPVMENQEDYVRNFGLRHLVPDFSLYSYEPINEDFFPVPAELWTYNTSHLYTYDNRSYNCCNVATSPILQTRKGATARTFDWASGYPSGQVKNGTDVVGHSQIAFDLTTCQRQFGDIRISKMINVRGDKWLGDATSSDGSILLPRWGRFNWCPCIVPFLSITPEEKDRILEEESRREGTGHDSYDRFEHPNPLWFYPNRSLHFLQTLTFSTTSGVDTISLALEKFCPCGSPYFVTAEEDEAFFNGYWGTERRYPSFGDYVGISSTEGQGLYIAAWQRTLGQYYIRHFMGDGSLSDHLGYNLTQRLFRQPFSFADNWYQRSNVRKDGFKKGTYTSPSDLVSVGIINDKPISILPYLSYAKVWSDFIRDPRFELRPYYVDPYRSPFLIPMTYNNGTYISGPLYYDDARSVYSSYSGINWKDSEFVDLFMLRDRRIPKDLFTMVTPNTQYGEEVGVDIPIELDTLGADGRTTVYSSTGEDFPNNTYLRAISSNQSLTFDGMSRLGSAYFKSVGNSKFSVNALRLAGKLQKFMERNNIVGSDFVKQQLIHFGVTPQGCQHCESTYLGGDKFEVKINSVDMLSSNTEDQQTGQQSGQCSASGTACKTSFHAREHGLIIQLMTIQNDFFYSQRFKFNPIDKYDFAFPEFADLPPEEVPLCDLVNTDGYFDPNSRYGYAPRYWRWKCNFDEIHGDFKNGLAYWVTPRQIESSLIGGSYGFGEVGNKPSISASMMYEMPNYDCFSYSGDDIDHCLVDMKHYIDVTRSLPVLPTPSIN